MKKRILSVLLATCVLGTTLLAGCGGTENTDNETTTEAATKDNSVDLSTYEPPTIPSDEEQIYDFGLAETTEEGVILHAFCWSFATITESMADIAAAGYTSIQTSPINEVYDGDPGMQLLGDGKWYYNYQATDYKIGNYQLGTRDEFIAMCDEADKYGIKIIVDVAPNHTTTRTDYVSENLINAVGGMDNLYHKNGTVNISNYSDRFNSTAYALGGLPDIDTENPAYQLYMIEYLNDCIACGADGFRFDAARHIALSDDPSEDDQETNFWDMVLGNLANKDKLFTYGEVLQGDNERIDAYIKTIGAATASNYGKALRARMMNGKIDVDTLESYNAADSTDVVLWVESHDNYINDNTSKTITNEQVELAWAIIAARSEGTPLFFDRPYGSDTENVWGPVNEIGIAGSTIYKSATVSAVNHFRNAMIGESEKLVNPDGNEHVLLIERGSKGLVIVNTDEEYKLDMATSLADGTYVNRVDKTTEYAVKDGKISGTIAGSSVVVLYNEGYVEREAMPVVSADASEYYAMTNDTVEVTLHVSGASEGVYVLGDGEEVAYKDGTVITVGDTINAGQGVKLTVKATNGEGYTSAMSYMFTKAAKEEEVTIVDGITVYFEKPSHWGNTIYTYIYDDSSGTLKILKDWPGNKMTDLGDGRYSYTFESVWSTGVIMFSDGANQYPSSNEPGTPIEAEKVYSP